MKKLIVLFAAAVMILPLVSSCNKQDQPTKEVVMEPAATADVAKSISFESATTSANPTYTKAGRTYEILSIEFTEDSRYILRRRPLLTGSGAVGPWTKADDGIEVVVGKFTESNGVYKCEGEYSGTVEPKADGTITVTPQGSQAQETKATVKETTSTTTEGVNASRTWRVSDCYIKISGEGINVETGFNGCDFKEIADYLASTGVKIDASKLAGFRVVEVLFTGEDNMAIVFADGSAFYGTYRLSGENISYTLTSGGNDLMGRTATGTMTFPANKRAELGLTTSVKGYTGALDLSMVQAN